MLNIEGNKLPKTLAISFISLIWLAWTFFGLYFICFHLNITLIDAAGHIASAVSFSRGLYHHFNDSFFSGLIQGLFYPPLEDFILGTIIKVFPFSILSIYTLYLCFLWLTTNTLLYRLCIKLSNKNWFALILAIISCAFFQSIEKPGLIPHQGLSFVDLWYTGLTAENLGFCFFILLIHESLETKENLKRSTLWLSLCILSHLIVGIVAMLIWLLFFLMRSNRKERIIHTAIALLGTAFFWLPMLYYSDQIVKVTIFSNENEWIFLLIAASFIIIHFLIKEKINELIIAATLIFGVQILGKEFWENTFRSIPFHYYRLDALGKFLLIFSITKLSKKSKVLFLNLILLICAFYYFPIQKYDFHLPEMTKSEIQKSDFSHLDILSNVSARILTIGENRSVDFAVDSIVNSYIDDIQFTKGLHWEANERNALLNSYLTSLISTPGVLQSEFYDTDDCKELTCIWNQFFNDFNITQVAMPPKNQLTYFSANKKECLLNLLNQTGKKTEFIFNKKTYTLFNASNSSTTKIIPFKRMSEHWYNDYFLTVVGSCSMGNYPTQLITKPMITKMNDQEYEILVNSIKPTRFSIPFNFVPGMKLYSESGNEIPLNSKEPIVTATGKGKIKLTFKKTPLIIFSEITSFITLILLLISLINTLRANSFRSVRAFTRIF